MGSKTCDISIRIVFPSFPAWSRKESSSSIWRLSSVIHDAVFLNLARDSTDNY